jgi:GTPase SAR1 family protein
VFTGRKEILDQLKSSCLPAEWSHSQQQEEHHHQQQKRFVIHGLGGCGKTQLCLKFAEEHREK